MSTKFLQLLVPNYDGCAGPSATSGPALTYLRLGSHYPERSEFSDEAAFSAAVATESVAPAHTGNELLKDAQGNLDVTFKDDGWLPRRPGVYAPDDNGDKTYRYWDGASLDMATTDPTTLNAKLLTRGGWREHTDGNRISTTRGDCVEVVGGNYKLIVMGRVEGPNVGPSTWEISGGHSHDSTSHPGEVTSIEWSEAEDGTWKVVETTRRGNTISYYQGKQEEHFFGPSMTSLTTKGQSTSDSYDTSYPILEEETWAKSVSGETHASSITETTTIRADGSSTEYTYADEIEDFTGAVPLEEVMLQRENTYATDLISKTVFDERHSHSIGAASVAVSMAATAETSTGAKFGLDFSGATADLKLAAKAEMHVGAGLELSTTNTWEYKLAAKLEINLGMLLAGAFVTLGVAAVKAKTAVANLRSSAQEVDLPAVELDN